LQHARVLQADDFLFQAADAAVRFGKVVRDGQRSHDCQSRVADLAKFAAQFEHALFKRLRELFQVLFLPVFASETILAPVNCRVHLPHESYLLRMI
jgi:hypothetical protein